MTRRSFFKSFLGLPLIPIAIESEKKEEEPLVVYCNQVLNQAQSEQIEKRVREAFPNYRILVLDGGLSLQKGAPISINYNINAIDVKDFERQIKYNINEVVRKLY